VKARLAALIDVHLPVDQGTVQTFVEMIRKNFDTHISRAGKEAEFHQIMTMIIDEATWLRVKLPKSRAVFRIDNLSRPACVMADELIESQDDMALVDATQLHPPLPSKEDEGFEDKAFLEKPSHGPTIEQGLAQPGNKQTGFKTPDMKEEKVPATAVGAYTSMVANVIGWSFGTTASSPTTVSNDETANGETASPAFAQGVPPSKFSPEEMDVIWKFTPDIADEDNRVKFVISPVLEKIGNADGENYDVHTILCKAKVVMG
jgi:hypothetical protein